MGSFGEFESRPLRPVPVLPACCPGINLVFSSYSPHILLLFFHPRLLHASVFPLPSPRFTPGRLSALYGRCHALPGYTQIKSWSKFDALGSACSQCHHRHRGGGAREKDADRASAARALKDMYGARDRRDAGPTLPGNPRPSRPACRRRAFCPARRRCPFHPSRPSRA